MIFPVSTLCVKCDKDVIADEVKGVVGIGMQTHYVCQPCGENYRIAEMEFCNSYFKKEKKEESSEVKDNAS